MSARDWIELVGGVCAFLTLVGICYGFFDESDGEDEE